MIIEDITDKLSKGKTDVEDLIKVIEYKNVTTIEDLIDKWNKKLLKEKNKSALMCV
jgi:hypothetical protein